MKKILYYDCFAGISGDMNLGALVDLGVPAEHLEKELALLNIEGFRLEVERDIRKGISGTKVAVGLGVVGEGAVTGAVTIVLVTGGAAVSATGSGVLAHPPVTSRASRSTDRATFPSTIDSMGTGRGCVMGRLLTAPN